MTYTLLLNGIIFRVYAPTYSRFDVTRPPLLAQEYWTSIESELLRLERSLTANDDVQAIGDAKCLVQATAKVVWDINGTPADSNENFPKLVARAHELLGSQPGVDCVWAGKAPSMEAVAHGLHVDSHRDDQTARG